jgi:hypothetical protein
VWESGREKVEMGGLAEGSGKGCEVSSFEFQGFVDGRGVGDVVGTSGTEGVRLCCKGIELRECGPRTWG